MKEEFYKKRYDNAIEELHMLHYQLGWLKGSLKQLEKMIESSDIKCSDINMSQLKRIAIAFETSAVQAKKHSAGKKARVEKL